MGNFMEINRMFIGVIIIITIVLCVGCDERKSNVAKKGNSVAGNHTTIETEIWGKELLLEDFDQLSELVLDKHSFLFSDENHFKELVSENRQQITDNMSLEEFYRLAKSTISELECGHSRVFPSSKMRAYRYNQGSYLPLQINVVGGEAIVEKDFSDKVPEIEGSRILSINALGVESIIDTCSQLMATDGGNESTKNFMMSHWFSECFYESYGRYNEYIVIVENENGEEEGYILKGITEEVLEVRRQQWKSMDTFETMVYDDYGLIRLPSFAYYEKIELIKFKEQLDDFFDELYHEDNLPLIVDIRNNWGGDPISSAYLLSYLAQEPFIYFAETGGGSYYSQLIVETEPQEKSAKGEIYLIVDGSCFSTAGHFSALFKYHKMGTIVGQRTGGGYACSDNSQSHELSNTQIGVRLSETIFQVDISDMELGRGVIPDIYYEETPDDIYQILVEY